MMLKETIIRLILLFPLGIYSCCNILTYSSACIGQEISTTIHFPQTFSGTVFADGYLGDPKCSSPNLNPSNTNEISLKLPFKRCNTRIGTVKGKVYPQAMNKVIVQFHPLVRSNQDCEINIACDIYYTLPSGFYNSFLKRNMEIASKDDSRLFLMTGSELFGEELSYTFRISSYLYLVIYLKDEGIYRDLRIRACFAHADNVTNPSNPPVMIAEPNTCPDTKGEFPLKPDRNSSSVRGFATLKDPHKFVSYNEFYITCAFDACNNLCPFICGKKIQNEWITVRTYVVRFPVTYSLPNNEVGKRRAYLTQASLDAWQRRLDNIQKQFDAEVRTHAPKQRVARSMVESLLPQTDDSISNITEAYESGSIIDVVKTSTNIGVETEIPGLLNDSEENQSNSESSKENSTHDQNRPHFFEPVNPMLVETQTNLSLDNVQPTDSDIEPGKTCLNSTCMLNIVNISVPDISGTSNQSTEQVSGSTEQNSNSTVVPIGTSDVMSSENPTSRDCVPRLKFVSVTATLSVLCVCFFFICIGVVLHTRKELKRHTSLSTYLYNDF